MAMDTIRYLRLVLTISVVSLGVSNAQPLDSLTLVYRNWELQKLSVIQFHLDVEEFEKAPFLAAYKEYSETIEAIEIDYLRITHFYAMHGSGLPDEKRRMIANHLLENDCLLAQVRMQYFRKFQRVLSARRASQLMELDQILRTMFRMSIRNQEQIPRPTTPDALTKQKKSIPL